MASSIGAACAAALALSLSAPAATAAEAPPLPGSTQSLPLEPLTSPQPSGSLLSSGSSDPSGAVLRVGTAVRGGPVAYGLPAQDVDLFALLGLVWDDPDAELHGRVEVRTRAADTGDWSEWRGLETHADHTPDAASSEEHQDDSAHHRHDDHDGGVHGSTPPVWVGDSDGVQVRVLPEKGESAPRIPAGLRLELVHPGDAASAPRIGRIPGQAAVVGAAGFRLAPLGPLGPRAVSVRAVATTAGGALAVDFGDRHVLRAGGLLVGARSTAPRPPIVTRKGWGADESLREPEFRYTDTVKTAFVHHTAMTNDYSCEEAPSIIRAIYRYHVKSNGWRDVGYNFFIDKCGTIYEGRAGGVDKPVMGAHTGGFNSDSTGIALLGNYTDAKPPGAAVDAFAAVAAWKLGLHDVDAQGSTVMTSEGSNKYPKGAKVELRTVSGHRDAFVTDCPGGRLYDRLGAIREKAALLQGG